MNEPQNPFDIMQKALDKARELSKGTDKDAQIEALNDLIEVTEDQRAELLGAPDSGKDDKDVKG